MIPQQAHQIVIEKDTLPSIPEYEDSFFYPLSNFEEVFGSEL